ncbi:glycosyltransferase family 2 protein [Paracoccus ravus]|uniref:glycosyltransferase family 2 protein n=1 Tax=Paracoccus ravus TaxID=2447760 RepID=UPI00106EA4CD|nr:glycosyltransferase [Paracoccus ravus]
MEKVSVIIPAYNAFRTIGQAVSSALLQPEVAEVVVVDDASTDDTAAAAWRADDASGRLKVLRLESNGGPALARNKAIAASSAPWIAILDSDDMFLPARFTTLFAAGPFDLAADNIALIADQPANRRAQLAIPQLPACAKELALTQFIAGNLTQGGMGRNETGLLKPLIRRDLLQRTGLSYDEDLRLGEDFILYVRLMARGARFITINSCGYVAFQRADSLSARHRTDDLRTFSEASACILRTERIPPAARKMLVRQQRLTRDKYHHRLFLDRKAEVGLLGAARETVGSADRFWAVFRLTLRDKFMALRKHLRPNALAHEHSGIRLLMNIRNTTDLKN